MAVQNTLQKTRPADQVVTFLAGNATVTLSPQVVKNYLVSGDKDNITMEELVLFINLCKYQGLNPFLREAYLVKYGKEKATMVTGKDAFMKRAQRNSNYRGCTAGIIVRNGDNIEQREGTFKLDEEILVGGWAKVLVKGYDAPISTSVSLSEYIGKKSDGTPNKQWSRMPSTMLRKVALVQALREAFPDDYAGMYDADEMGLDSSMLSDTPIASPDAQPEYEADVVYEYDSETTLFEDDPLG